jgi:tetratricopeptide (TPR) repeat protein
MNELNETQPTQIKEKPSRSSFWLGLLVIVLFVAVGVYGGYQAGLGDRQSAQATQIAASLQEQFDLGVQALADGKYDLARQYFAYVLENDPNFPGAADKLTDALVKLGSTATPAPTLTPAPTPTPDTRGVEAIFNDARAKLAAQDWEGAIQTLDSLRRADRTFKTVEVDGMYYVALRNRGVDKILGRGAYMQEPNLEGGIYDLSLAERFGPLDGEAAGFRNFARAYLNGARVWEINWENAAYWFSQAMALPNLRDSTGLTSVERYIIAITKYGDQFAKEEKWCDAVAQYDLVIGYPVAANDQAFMDNYNLAFEKCTPATATPGPTSTPTETATPDPNIIPSDTPVPSETPTEMPTP